MSVIQAPGLLQSSTAATRIAGMRLVSSAVGVCRTCIPELISEMYRGNEEAIRVLARICPSSDPRLDEMVSYAISAIVLDKRNVVSTDRMVPLLQAYSGRGTLRMRTENWKAVLHLFEHGPESIQDLLKRHLQFFALTIADQQLLALLSDSQMSELSDDEKT